MLKGNQIFLSTYEAKVDEKNRISIPANFRNILDAKGSREIYAYSSFISQLKFHEYPIAAQSFCFLLDFINDHNPNLIKNISDNNLIDKIIIKSDMYLVGQRKVFSHNEPLIPNSLEGGKYVYSLSPLIDMNLSAEYRYNKKVSGFIHFNNFIGKKYQYWSNFPVQSINILGGVTFSF